MFPSLASNKTIITQFLYNKYKNSIHSITPKYRKRQIPFTEELQYTLKGGEISRKAPSYGILCPRIISRTTASCGLSFLLAIIIPPDCVILSYISLEVYTNFGMGPFLTGNLLTLYYIPVREYHFLTLIINHYLNCRCFPTSLFCFLS